jgi:hypothetical protein
MQSFVVIPIPIIVVGIVKNVKIFTSLILCGALPLTAGTEEVLTVSTVIIRSRAANFNSIS